MAEGTSVAIWIALTFVAAGLVKGVVGMGLPTLAMGVLSLVMPPSAAAAMLIVPSFVTNVWQLLAGPAFGGLFRRLATMMLGVCVGTALGIHVLIGPSAQIGGIALGAVLAIYGAIGLAAPRVVVSNSAERWLSPLSGFVTGLFTGATGVFVIPAVPYLNSLGLGKEELIQALGISFTVSTIALAAALGVTGQFQLAAAWTSLLAVIPALAGMFIGQRIRSKLRPEVFRKCFLVGLVVLGVYMILRIVVQR
jgi:uncharacterized protein